jgi:predicted permease
MRSSRRSLGASAGRQSRASLASLQRKRRAEPAAESKAAPALLIALKLIVQLAIAWVLADKVFALTLVAAKTAVLMAASPTGTGSFMLAEYYRREAKVTSAVILFSTIWSLFTISAYLAFVG